VLLLTLPLVLLVALTIPLLQDYLHYHATLPFVALFASQFISVIATFNNATLQGQKQFKVISFMSILQALSKLVIALSLIYIGLGVLGSMLGLLAAGIIGYLYTRKYVGSWQAQSFKSWQAYKQALIELLPELRYGLLSLITLASMALLFTIDVIAVKHYFDPATAGLYAGISTVAKIAYFVLTPLSAVLLPSVASEGKSVAGRKHIVKVAGSILLSMSAVGLTIVYFAHGLITGLLFGERFVQLSALLPRLTLAMVLLAVLYNMVMYGLALRAKVLGYALPLGVATVLVLNTLSHQSLQAIVTNVTLGTLIPILILGALYLYGLHTIAKH
jgi:O-antigen/teichoic acid export membrane protein